MRHIFDQYTQPENKLTHALISSLAEDPKLLKKFIYWITGDTLYKEVKIKITEQTLPGEEEPGEESEQKGLPDAWIYVDNNWCLLIESKVSSPLSVDQLRRHLSMARRRGFLNPKLLAITVTTPKFKLPSKICIKHWRDIYEWSIRNSFYSEWANRLATYLEIAEARMIQKQYLKAGTLTRFSGVPFDSEHPYNYIEAKRLLGLLMEELRNNNSFVEKVGVDPKLPGRGAKRGKRTSVMWDLLRVKESKNAKNFRQYPHLTIVIRGDFLSAYVTIPDSIQGKIRSKILGDSLEDFCQLIGKILRNMKVLFKMDPSVKPQLEIVQRHYYPSQSSPATLDARLKYDLRTIVKQKGKAREKYQPEWLKATYEVMTHKRSNLQLSIGMDIFYEKSKVIKTSKTIVLIEKIFVSLNPLLKIALDRK